MAHITAFRMRAYHYAVFFSVNSLTEYVKRIKHINKNDLTNNVFLVVRSVTINEAVLIVICIRAEVLAYVPW